MPQSIMCNGLSEYCEKDNAWRRRRYIYKEGNYVHSSLPPLKLYYFVRIPHLFTISILSCCFATKSTAPQNTTINKMIHIYLQHYADVSKNQVETNICTMSCCFLKRVYESRDMSVKRGSSLTVFGRVWG